MGFIFGRAVQDEPECPGVRKQDGELRPCCGASPKATPADPPKEETQRVVTLVHGTFAMHASWMRDAAVKAHAAVQVEESSLCAELRELPGTVLRRFCWSGGNSHTARLQAGDDLAEYLRALRSEFPNAKHFVIAHSHGGNVALYAMEKTSPDGRKLGEGVTGIVTLATPFLTLRKRQLPRFVLPSVWITMLFMLVVSLITVIWPNKQLFFRYPAEGYVRDEVPWIFDLPQKGASELTFQWCKTDDLNNKDGKENELIWKDAKAAVGSPLKNPANDVKPSQNLQFVWDSTEDLRNEKHSVTLRVRVDEGKVGTQTETTIETTVDNTENSTLSIEDAARTRTPPPTWNSVIFVTVLFAIWVTATLMSSLLYRRKNFSPGILFQLFRDRHKEVQGALDDQLVSLRPESLDDRTSSRSTAVWAGCDVLESLYFHHCRARTGWRESCTYLPRRTERRLSGSRTRPQRDLYQSKGNPPDRQMDQWPFDALTTECLPFGTRRYVQYGLSPTVHTLFPPFLYGIDFWVARIGAPFYQVQLECGLMAVPAAVNFLTGEITNDFE